MDFQLPLRARPGRHNNSRIQKCDELASAHVPFLEHALSNAQSLKLLRPSGVITAIENGTNWTRDRS
jgi:hypothetical protein